MSIVSSGAEVSNASGRLSEPLRQLSPRVSRVGWFEAALPIVRAGSVVGSQRRSESQNCWATVGVPSCGRFGFEPTESVGRADLDAFVEAMIDIDREAQTDPQLVIDAPHSTRIGRLDEASAARKPVLRWRENTDTSATAA